MSKEIRVTIAQGLPLGPEEVMAIVSIQEERNDFRTQVIDLKAQVGVLLKAMSMQSNDHISVEVLRSIYLERE